ncbi:MAG: Gfo/Idh/MocA family oxidoreductase [Oscillospiraceae bacterium]|jgi:predicted dehydrogenase|nr:Gfo/Idh/MocA family oxidoreductase [Oscillospiraceae bacterium]
MLRIGLISFWHVHAPGYAKDLDTWEETEITAVWDELPARGQEWAEKLGVAFEADYDAFLAREDIDAVACGAPTTMHAALLAKAAAAGKHIFTEKLLTPGAVECAALCRAIRASKVTFTISLPCKCSPEALYIKALVESGALGKVTGARFRRSHSGVSDNWLPAYWFDTAMTGGGALMDLGAHPVYILAWLFGAPTRLTALLNNPEGTSSDENAIALAEFPGGILGTMETGFLTNGVPDLLEVYGTEGAVYLRGNELAQNLRSEGVGLRPVTQEELPAAKPAPLRQFVEACLAGVDAPAGLGLEDALVMTKMIEASYKANASGVTQQV